jgi:NADH:ubiquinone oxidoreductase subunit 2 (subunit N)
MINAVIARGGFLWLVILAVLMAAISVYYYFRVIQAMYFKDGEAQAIEVSSSFNGSLVLLLHWLFCWEFILSFYSTGFIFRNKLLRKINSS